MKQITCIHTIDSDLKTKPDTNSNNIPNLSLESIINMYPFAYSRISTGNTCENSQLEYIEDILINN